MIQTRLTSLARLLTVAEIVRRATLSLGATIEDIQRQLIEQFGRDFCNRTIHRDLQLWERLGRSTKMGNGCWVWIGNQPAAGAELVSAFTALPTGPQGIHRRLDVPHDKNLFARLWTRVKRGEKDKCWLWTGAQRNGYGAIKANRQVYTTHAVAFVANMKTIPMGSVVMHTCENKLCCNPNHLKTGTYRASVRKMVDKGLSGKEYITGELNPRAVLSAEMVCLAHSLNLIYGWLGTDIGHYLKASPRTIANAIEGKSWKHVPKPSYMEALQIVERWERTQPERLKICFDRSR